MESIEHIGRLVRMSVLNTEVDGSNPAAVCCFLEQDTLSALLHAFSFIICYLTSFPSFFPICVYHQSIKFMSNQIKKLSIPCSLTIYINNIYINCFTISM